MKNKLKIFLFLLLVVSSKSYAQESSYSSSDDKRHSLSSEHGKIYMSAIERIAPDIAKKIYLENNRHNIVVGRDMTIDELEKWIRDHSKFLTPDK